MLIFEILKSYLKVIFIHMQVFRLQTCRLAQLVERGTFNPKVKGSSPFSGGFFHKIWKKLRFLKELKRLRPKVEP